MPRPGPLRPRPRAWALEAEALEAQAWTLEAEAEAWTLEAETEAEA